LNCLVCVKLTTYTNGVALQTMHTMQTMQTTSLVCPIHVMSCLEAEPEFQQNHVPVRNTICVNVQCNLALLLGPGICALVRVRCHPFDTNGTRRQIHILNGVIAPNKVAPYCVLRVYVPNIYRLCITTAKFCPYPRPARHRLSVMPDPETWHNRRLCVCTS
jgi:hypothetical protein